MDEKKVCAYCGNEYLAPLEKCLGCGAGQWLSPLPDKPEPHNFLVQCGVFYDQIADGVASRAELLPHNVLGCDELLRARHTLVKEGVRPIPPWNAFIAFIHPYQGYDLHSDPILAPRSFARFHNLPPGCFDQWMAIDIYDTSDLQILPNKGAGLVDVYLAYVFGIAEDGLRAVRIGTACSIGDNF